MVPLSKQGYSTETLTCRSLSLRYSPVDVA
jgi:hypothetical protein